MIRCKQTIAITIIFVLITSSAILQPLKVTADTAPRTITVPDDFSTIQDAVGNATAGDRVYVRAGNYTIPPNWADYELKIPNSVSLIGENPQNTIIETKQKHRGIFGWNYGIELQNDSEISGFTITGDIQVLALFGNGRITNNIINLTSTGYQAISALAGTISSNIINGVFAGDIGIVCGSSSEITISNNIINNFDIGIYIWGSHVNILNNTLTHNDLGISGNPDLLWQNNLDVSNSVKLRLNSGANVTYNWWGKNETRIVSRAIFIAGYDPGDLQGKVAFEPFLMAPNPQAMPVKPNVAVISLVNQKYDESSVPLTFTLDKPVSLMQYSLDGYENVTVDGNLTLTGLSNGVHNVTVYVKDALGSFVASETIQFSVYSSEASPILPIAVAGLASVVAIGVGLTYYLKKRRQ